MTRCDANNPWAKKNIDKPVDVVSDLLPPRLPWEQLRNETAACFKLFRTFRDMGAERSQAAVARKTKHSTNWVQRVAKKFRWDERAYQYDRHIERLKLRYEEDALSRMKKRQLGVANKFWKIVELEIAQILKQVEEASINDENRSTFLSVDQLLKLAEFAAKTERVNLDEPAEILGLKQVNQKKIQDLFRRKGAEEALSLLSKSLEE